MIDFIHIFFDRCFRLLVYSVFIFIWILSKHIFKGCRVKKDVKIKKRMLLFAFNIVFHEWLQLIWVDIHNKISSLQWLRGYYEWGIGELKDRAKTGRPSELSGDLSYRIKTISMGSNQG